MSAGGRVGALLRDRRVILGGSAIVVLGIVVAWVGGGANGGGAREVAVVRRRLARRVHAEARIEPIRPLARLATPTGGIVRRALVDEGAHVEAGATIIEFDVAEAEGQLALARAELAGAQANEQRIFRGAPQAERQRQQALLEEAQSGRDAARAEKERAVSLFSTGAITEQQRDEAVRADQAAGSRYEAAQRGYQLLAPGAHPEEAAAARAEVDAARAKVALAEMALERRRITAPFAGTVLTFLAHPGESVPPLAPVVIIADLSAMRARAEVDELNMAAVRVGERACAYLDAYPETEFCGEVTWRGSTLGRRHFDPDDPRSARSDLKVVEVLASLPSDPRLVSGLGAELVIEIADRGEVAVVPAAAVRRRGDATSVTVREAGGRFVEREVSLGETDGAFVELRGGLRDGDRVIVGAPRQ